MATKKKNPDTIREEWHVYFGEWADYDDEIIERGGMNDAIRCSSLEDAESELEQGLTDDNQDVGVIVHVQFKLIATGESVPRTAQIKKV